MTPSLHIVPPLPPRTNLDDKAMFLGAFLAVLIALFEWQRRRFAP